MACLAVSDFNGILYKIVLSIFAIVLHSAQSIYSPSQENQAFLCGRHLSSRSAKNGTIQSPYYPNPYTSDMTCKYVFEGIEGKERIQLRFTHMDLHYPGGDPSTATECDGVDAIIIRITVGNEQKNLATRCGKNLPPMVMSNDASMVVIFRSTQHPNTHSFTGFHAEYSFVTNFGITTGEQDPRNVCIFNYHSARKSSGIFMSPNYPGLYPRNTECHYLFFAKKNEYVRITFISFAVDGVRPMCDGSLQSDYVAFSNFQEVEDRSLERYCGSDIHPAPINSDGTFFRVIFVSNNIFDQHGFEARYQFIAEKNDYEPGPKTRNHKPVPGAGTVRSTGDSKSAANTETCIFRAYLLLLTLCVITR